MRNSHNLNIAVPTLDGFQCVTVCLDAIPMVSMGLRNFYRVPWDVWKRMKELYGRKYMKEEDLKPYQLQERQCTILILEGVELKDEN